MYNTVPVFDVDNGSCIPLKGARIDISHNDGTRDKNVTVRFTTIYPGRYHARTTHVHVRVRNGVDIQYCTKLWPT